MILLKLPSTVRARMLYARLSHFTQQKQVTPRALFTLTWL
jgi:hypothetical protein